MLTDDLETAREQIYYITQPTRFALLHTLIAHPKQAASMRELNHSLDNWARANLREHLVDLIDRDLVVSVSHDSIKRDQPSTFYSITESTEQLLSTHNLLEDRQHLRDWYSSLEKPEDVQRHQSAPRPDTQK